MAGVKMATEGIMHGDPHVPGASGSKDAGPAPTALGYGGIIVKGSCQDGLRPWPAASLVSDLGQVVYPLSVP